MTGFVFVHVPKTAGRAIRMALIDPPQQERRHAFARDLKAQLGADEWNARFSFGFVRNPWARLVSWHNMIQDHPRRPPRQTFAEFLERPGFDFYGSLLRGHIGYQQLDYLIDEGGQVIVDFIGRFEQLARDFAYVCERIGVVAELPRWGIGRPVNYRDYYTPELADRVAARHSRDIAAFGYEF